MLIIFLLFKFGYLALVPPEITHITQELKEITLATFGCGIQLKAFLGTIVYMVDNRHSSKLVFDDLIGPYLTENCRVPLNAVGSHRKHAIAEIEVLQIRTEIVEIILNALQALKLIIAKIAS